MGMHTQNSIKLISLNIERDQHYETALPFLKAEQADVICLQELLDRDVERFKEELGMDGLYAPTGVADRGRNTEALAAAGVCMGTGLFSRLPLSEARVLYYHGTPEKVPSSMDPVSSGWHENFNGILLAGTIEHKGASVTVGTTHFTWTPDGSVSEGQRQDIQVFLEKMREFPDIVFCGDFNAPRGGEIWGELASRYKDNIPVEYRTSIDPNLHIVKDLPHLVDGLFSSPKYLVSDVRLVEGVSDHKAVVGFIERIN